MQRFRRSAPLHWRSVSRMRTPHTVCARGQRVQVVLKNGEVIHAKFKERTPRWVLLEGHRLIPGDIKEFTIIKGGRTMNIKLVDVYTTGRPDGIAAGAIEFLYQILAERPPESNISHREMPTLEQHKQFVHRHPYRVWFLIENEQEQRVGALCVTERNEIGIAVLRTHQRKGYAARAIEELRAFLRPNSPVAGTVAGRFLANVAMNNHASHALFQKLGAKRIQITYEL